MGQCGCGDLNLDKVWRIGDFYLVADRYMSCRDCQTPIGVMLSIFTKKEAKDWGLKSEGKFEPENGYAEKPLPFFDVAALVKAAEKCEVNKSLGEYDSLADILHDYGLELIQEAFRIFQEKHPHPGDGPSRDAEEGDR